MTFVSFRWLPHVIAGLLLLVAAPLLVGQEDTSSAEKGKVVFSTEHLPAQTDAAVDVFPTTPVTNDERSAVVIVATDLDLHLTLAEAREEAHALLTLRNISSAPLQRIPLQITSTLRWSSFTLMDRKSRPIVFTQSPVTTDADHTGYAQEAVLTLAQPLAPGATLKLATFFAGQIPPSTARLELIGTPQAKAAETDWDCIAESSDDGATALRGFGEVLWYPVAAPTVLLGEGNQLFHAVSHQKLLNETATLKLRLTIVYRGEAPDAVIFNGRLHPIAHTADFADQIVDSSHGVATAEFPAGPIGFRTPSLFVTAQKAEGKGTMITVISPVPEAAEPYAKAAESLAPLFDEYFGADPQTTLLLLEHAGNAFEDGPFIAAHLSAAARPEDIAPELVRSLTHAYLSVATPATEWLDQGLPEFMSLVDVERSRGRQAALLQLQQNALPIALTSPDLLHSEVIGSPLVSAESDVALRLKGAAVLWQLREILGEEAFRKSLATFRRTLSGRHEKDLDQTAFERSLEQSSGQDLGWFFKDWVYRDRGLPDLTVTQINPRPLPAKGGTSEGYLVVVEVRNDGFAAAEVPVTLRAGSALSATVRLRIAARSSASTRIRFEGRPETLQVNDGSVPELRNSIHTMPVSIAGTTTRP